MKAGADSKTKVMIVAVLGALAIVLFARMLWTMGSNSTQPGPVAAPNLPAGVPPVRTGGRTTSAIAAPSLDPELRLGLLEASEGTIYEGKGRNIFVPTPEEIPKPVAPPLKPPEPPKPVAPPPPPPINLKFFGFASHPGEPKRIFLSTQGGEDVFIAAEGDIVNRRYKVLRINPSSVEIEDVLNNNRQTIPLTQS